MSDLSHVTRPPLGADLACASAKAVGRDVVDSTDERSATVSAKKRLFDVTVAMAATLLLLPTLLLLGLLIKATSPGPIIFKQRRIGLDGKVFRIWKFRTMHVVEDGDTITQARKTDNRVTKIGRLLRKSSLDELPQLFNVIVGTMSLVGPRPHAVAHDAFFASAVPEYRLRTRALPGLTGWAQVNGSRGETPDLDSVKRRVDLDLWYIDNQSFWLDLKIIMRTAILVFKNKDTF